ncbi:MAG: TonB family protein [bacterium]
MRKRTVISMPLAALVTLSLFVLMLQLIQHHPQKIVSSAEIPVFRLTKPPTEVIKPQPAEPELQKHDKPVPTPGAAAQSIPLTPSINRPKGTHIPANNLPIGLDNITSELPGIGSDSNAYNSPQPTIKMTLSPMYPEAARRKKIEGFVDAEISVDMFGNVINVEVVDAQPARVFNAAVVKSIYKWKFNPATVDGSPIPSVIKQHIAFNLDDE